MTYHSNIRKLQAIQAVRSFLLIMPVIIPFFKSNDLNMTEIMLLQSIMAATIVITEIPSGYLSDLFDRKWSIVLGSAFTFTGMLNLYFATGFWGFAFTEVCMGIGISFVSGADSAMLYDSLLSDGKSEQYIKHQGHLTSISGFSEAVAGIFGGILFAWYFYSPILVQSVILFGGIYIALRLKEPPRKKLKASETSQNFKQVFRFIKQHHKIKWWLAYTAIIGTTTLTTSWITQPYLLDIDINVKYFGIWWTGLNLAVAAGAFLSNTIHKKISAKTIVIAALLIITFALVAAGWLMSVYGLFFFFLIKFVRGVKEPILNNYINHHTPSEIRATVFSVKSFFIRSIFALFGPFVGLMLDVYNFITAMVATCLILLILGTYVVFMLNAVKALKN